MLPLEGAGDWLDADDVTIRPRREEGRVSLNATYVKKTKLSWENKPLLDESGSEEEELTLYPGGRSLDEEGEGDEGEDGDGEGEGEDGEGEGEEEGEEDGEGEGEYGGKVYTVEQAVDHIGLGWFQYQLLLVCGLFTITDALEMLLLAVLSPVLRCEWLLSESQVAFITTVVFIGMFIGSVMWGKFADIYGRRPIIMLNAVWICYMGILTAFSPNYYWILVLRGLVGLGFGGAIQAATLQSEYLPSKHRARLFIIGGMFWAVGTSFEMILAYYVLPTLGWRWLVALSALPMILTIIFNQTLPESARFLLAAGRHDEAVAVLQRAARQNKSELPPGRLVSGTTAARGKLGDLLVPSYRRTSLCLWVQWFAMAFDYYGVVLLTSAPEVLNHPRTCGAEKLYAAIPAHDDCHCHYLTAGDYQTMIIATLGEFCAIPLTLVTIDTIGRRRTLALCLTVTAMFFYLTQLCTTTTWLTVFVFGIRAFSTGGTIYLYTTEVYPTTLRSVGLGLCSSMARIGAMITPFCAQVLIRWSLPASVSLYGTISLICAINALFLPIETKGRAMPQSQ